MDWDDEQSRAEFLTGIVADADRLLGLADEALASLEEEEVARHRIQRAAELISQLISRDVERHEGRVTLKEGVARDRVVSVRDPEQRHGRKSSSRRFDGHKAAIAVDAESQLITAVEILAGNAASSEKALALTTASEENTGLDVEETIGDCAYGSGNTRQAFADEDRKLVAKVSRHGRRGQVPREEFRIDVEKMTCTCPAGQITETLIRAGKWTDRHGKKQQRWAFLSDADVCSVCTLRSECTKARGRFESRLAARKDDFLVMIDESPTVTGLSPRKRSDARVNVRRHCHPARSSQEGAAARTRPPRTCMVPARRTG